jgi:predicted HTH domain antitoxin
MKLKPKGVQGVVYMNTDLYFHLPDPLSAQLVAAHEAGYYDSEEELVAEAVRTFLAARPDVRVAAACRLYERGTVSLEKAGELAGLNSVAMKQALHQRGISRVSPESLAETESMARAALQSSGHAV